MNIFADAEHRIASTPEPVSSHSYRVPTLSLQSPQIPHAVARLGSPPLLLGHHNASQCNTSQTNRTPAENAPKVSYSMNHIPSAITVYDQVHSCKTAFLAPKRPKLRLVSFSPTIGVASCIISHRLNGKGCCVVVFPPSFFGSDVMDGVGEDDVDINCKPSPSPPSEHAKRKRRRGSLDSH